MRYFAIFTLALSWPFVAHAQSVNVDHFKCLIDDPRDPRLPKPCENISEAQLNEVLNYCRAAIAVGQGETVNYQFGEVDVCSIGENGQVELSFIGGNITFVHIHPRVSNDFVVHGLTFSYVHDIPVNSGEWQYVDCYDLYRSTGELFTTFSMRQIPITSCFFPGAFDWTK